MDLTIRIAEKLKGIGEDYESLKPFMKEYLEKIEEIIVEKEKIQEAALKNLKNSTFSVSSISSSIKCSRTTLYNHNQLLKKYIEYSKQISDNRSPSSIIENLKLPSLV